MVVAVMPRFFSRPDTSPVSSSTPIEPVSVPFTGEDARGGHRDHVAGRCRRAAHHRDDRLLRGDTGDRIVQALAAGDAAAGAVDRHDQRLHAVVVRELVHRIVELAVLGDDAADGQPRQVRPAERQMRAAQPTSTAASTASTAKLRQNTRRRLSRRRSSRRSVSSDSGRWSAVRSHWRDATDPASRPLQETDHGPLTVSSRSRPAGCGDGSPRRGCRPARRRNPTSRIRPSPASLPRPPCP